MQESTKPPPASERAHPFADAALRFWVLAKAAILSLSAIANRISPAVLVSFFLAPATAALALSAFPASPLLLPLPRLSEGGADPAAIVVVGGGDDDDHDHDEDDIGATADGRGVEDEACVAAFQTDADTRRACV
jgi:hypothetical protein